MDKDTDVASILRNIAAESDLVTGKILKAAEKAAAKGLDNVTVDVRYEDYRCVRFAQLKEFSKTKKLVDEERTAYHRYEYEFAGDFVFTPLVEKLKSLNFKLAAKTRVGWSDTIFQLIISW